MLKFCKQMETEAEIMKSAGRYRTSVIYRSCSRRFLSFLKGKDVTAKKIDGMLMREYERFLFQSGMCRNTVSFYLRPMKAVYNRLVYAGIIRDARPFRHVYTGVDETRKRALPNTVIGKIRSAGLDDNPGVAFARDMFMFSFYTRGMSFIDMARLKKTDIQCGFINYRRHKTGKLMRQIKLEPCISEIIERYKGSNRTPYLFNILSSNEHKNASLYKAAQSRINHGLRKLGEIVGLEFPLTMYVARHSWASVAYNLGTPVALISESMGHGSERATRIYLQSFDTQSIDEANKKVMESVTGG